MPRIRRHSGHPCRVPMQGRLQRATLSGVLAAATLLVGCSQVQPYLSPQFPFMPGYGAHKTGAPVLLTNAAWWNGFQDPVLDQLVALALADNLSIAAARERVVAARINSQATANPLGLDGTASTRARNSGSSTVTVDEASLGLSWMLDPYGQRRSQLAAAGARLEVADAEADAARLLVLYNLGNGYVDLRYYQRLLSLRRQETISRQHTVQLANTMLQTSAGTQLDLIRAKARLADVEAQIPTLEAQVRSQINQIAVLTGRPPGQLPLDLTKSHGQPQSRLSPEVGIPADLLRNRPDIRVAERQYYAAVADTGAAKAAQFPQLSLGGAISLRSIHGAGSTHDAYFGPVLSLPDVNARSTVDLRLSAARLAHTTWKSTVLEAILEVENALLQYQASQRARSSAEHSLALYTDARSMIQQLLDTGSATISDVIDADQSVTQAANTMAETRRQQGLDFISLNVRLGSGSRSGAATGSDP